MRQHYYTNTITSHRYRIRSYRRRSQVHDNPTRLNDTIKQRNAQSDSDAQRMVSPHKDHHAHDHRYQGRAQEAHEPEQRVVVRLDLVDRRLQRLAAAEGVLDAAHRRPTLARRDADEDAAVRYAGDGRGDEGEEYGYERAGEHHVVGHFARWRRA